VGRRSCGCRRVGGDNSSAEPAWRRNGSFVSWALKRDKLIAAIDLFQFLDGQQLVEQHEIEVAGDSKMVL
jgi:hypothetical protein